MAASGLVENKSNNQGPQRGSAEQRDTATALTAPIIGGVVAQEVSISQAALLVNRGERTIRRYLEQGLLPAIRLPNGQIRIRVADLDRLGKPLIPTEAPPTRKGKTRMSETTTPMTTKTIVFLGTDGTAEPRQVPNLRFDPTLYDIIGTRMIEGVYLGGELCMFVDENSWATSSPRRNPAASEIVGYEVFGNAVLVGESGEHYRGLKPEEADMLCTLLKKKLRSPRAASDAG